MLVSIKGRAMIDKDRLVGVEFEGFDLRRGTRLNFN